jgi:hypothetical protein
MSWKERYKRTLIPTQAVIVGVCVLLMIKYKMPVIGILVYFAVMQLGALFGAMWTTRLIGKFDRQRDRNKFNLKVL